MEALFKMNFDCGRMGSLEGIFIADTEDVDYLYNNRISIYFGEVLGKYSEISGTIGTDEIKLITTDDKVLDIFEKYELESGYNPLDENLCEWETDDVPDNGIEWSDCTVKEFIDFKRKGVIPEYYLDSYNEWLNNNN